MTATRARSTHGQEEAQPKKKKAKKESAAAKGEKEAKKAEKEAEKEAKTAEKEAKKAEKEAKKAEKASAPKKPLSAYIIFSQERRSAVLGTWRPSPGPTKLRTCMLGRQLGSLTRCDSLTSVRQPHSLRSSVCDAFGGSTGLAAPHRDTHQLSTEPTAAEAEPELKSPEVMKQLGAEWKELSADEKKPYEAKAEVSSMSHTRTRTHACADVHMPY